MSKRFICEKQQVTIGREISINGSVTIPSFKLGKDDNKAELIFTPKAYIKMYGLVDHFSTEVQWHGIVKRIDDVTFLVEDILIFPHEASAATVISNDEKYTEWLDSLADEDRNAMRLHGHSHVNMGITPSSVDNTYRKNMLANFGIPREGDDYFYIFLITNKRRELNVQIFDFTNNSLYDYADKEITINILCDDDEDLRTFINESDRLVTSPKVVSTGVKYYPYPQTGKAIGKSKPQTAVSLEEEYEDSLFDDMPRAWR